MAVDNSYYEDTDWSLQDFTTPKQKAEEAAKIEKGVCPKCQRHVGKGLFVHQKACNGRPDQA